MSLSSVPRYLCNPFGQSLKITYQWKKPELKWMKEKISNIINIFAISYCFRPIWTIFIKIHIPLKVVQLNGKIFHLQWHIIFFYSEKITGTNINFLPRLRIGKCEMLKNIKTTWMRRTRDDVNDRDLLFIDTNARAVNKVGKGMDAMPHLLHILQRSNCKNG